MTRDVLRPAVVVFTVKRSLTDRGFLPSIHFARPPLKLEQGNSDGGIGRLEVCTHTLTDDLPLCTPSRGSAWFVN